MYFSRSVGPRHSAKQARLVLGRPLRWDALCSKPRWPLPLGLARSAAAAMLVGIARDGGGTEARTPVASRACSPLGPARSRHASALVAARCAPMRTSSETTGISSPACSKTPWSGGVQSYRGYPPSNEDHPLVARDVSEPLAHARSFTTELVCWLYSEPSESSRPTAPCLEP